jgi:uroporphyrin-III C-methyltransferase/precorrin-2 dehydrogenase/sirohydrochlorin ferrochelatase
MHSLPLFHRLAGKPVVVLGEGGMAEPKRRLVERAGGVVVTDLQQGIDQGAQLAFIAHDDAARCEADAGKARALGLLVNVVDRPDLCDFTTPSLLERDPVIVAIGTGGASAGLAKQLRLRLEALLPADLGTLASRLSEFRERIRAKFPRMADRRQALDKALTSGGVLDPLQHGSADRIEAWLQDAVDASIFGAVEIVLTSTDPEDLTLRQSRLLGSADVVLHEGEVPAAILDRARADAQRVSLPADGRQWDGLVVLVKITGH